MVENAKNKNNHKEKIDHADLNVKSGQKPTNCTEKSLILKFFATNALQTAQKNRKNWPKKQKNEKLSKNKWSKMQRKHIKGNRLKTLELI